MSINRKVSLQDLVHLNLLRKNVESFMRSVFQKYVRGPRLLLDVAPQDHSGARSFFKPEVRIETLDIDSSSDATYTADLCSCVGTIGENCFDFVVCMEVLEHSRQPFHAVNSIYRMLKSGRGTFISTPFNFHIHGPLADCWRFTEHSLRELFKKFGSVEVYQLECEDRFPMPIQYTLVAKKPFDD